VRPRRAALAAIAAVSLLVSGDARSLAEPSASEEQPPKATDDQAPKPAEDSASKSRMVSILGREVTNRDGDGGRIIDVLVDLDGRSGAVVVEFGGFMGIGSRKVAVEWSALRFLREGNRTSLVIDVNREQIRDAAEYKSSEPPTILTTK
jgi:hypothetical protein